MYHTMVLDEKSIQCNVFQLADTIDADKAATVATQVG
jgi:hypothetical protein